MAFKKFVNKLFKGSRKNLDDFEKEPRTVPEVMPEEDDIDIKVESSEEPFENSLDESDYSMDTQAEGLISQVETLGELEIFVKDELVSAVPVTEAEVRIGRDPLKATAVISEAIISKLHCTVFIRGNKVFIRDEGSTNGTFIDRNRINEYELYNGCVISLGKKGTVRIIFKQEIQ